MPETLKQKRAIEFHRAYDQVPGKEVSPNVALKGKEEVIYEKAKPYHKEYKQL